MEMMTKMINSSHPLMHQMISCYMRVAAVLMIMIMIIVIVEETYRMNRN